MACLGARLTWILLVVSIALSLMVWLWLRLLRVWWVSLIAGLVGLSVTDV